MPLRSWVSRAAACRPGSREGAMDCMGGAAAVTGTGATAGNPSMLRAHTTVRNSFDRILMATTAMWSERSMSGSHQQPRPAPAATPQQGVPMPYRVVIIGAGFGGIGMAIRLKHAGIEDFVVVERADDLGGTWRDNSYPGLTCDVPSQLYSFSFRPSRWSRRFPGRGEILGYLHELV